MQWYLLIFSGIKPKIKWNTFSKILCIIYLELYTNWELQIKHCSKEIKKYCELFWDNVQTCNSYGKLESLYVKQIFEKSYWLWLQKIRSAESAERTFQNYTWTERLFKNAKVPAWTNAPRGNHLTRNKKKSKYSGPENASHSNCAQLKIKDCNCWI